MGFLRCFSSRRVLAVATAGLFVAGLGGACAAQDERGAVTQASPYQGRYLTWAGKKPAPPPAQDDAADLTEARFAPNADYTPGGAAPRAPRAEPASYAPSRYEAASDDVSASRNGSSSSDDATPYRYQPPATQAADDGTDARYAAPPTPHYSPASHYASASPPAEVAQPTQPTAAPRYATPVRQAAPSPDAQLAAAPATQAPTPHFATSRAPDAPAAEGADGLTEAQADAPALFPPPAPPAPAAAAAAQPAAPSSPAASYAAAPKGPAAPEAEGDSKVRFYSLHREYGMTPDPIPEPTEGHTVLIGPPDPGPGANQDQSDQDQNGVGADDKPAAKPDTGPSGDK